MRDRPDSDDYRFRKQFLSREVAKLTDGDLASASLLILGTDNPALSRFGLDPVSIDASFGIIVKKNPLNPSHVVAVAAGRSREDIDRARRKLTNNRKVSILLFEQGIRVQRELEKADNGIRAKVH